MTPEETRRVALIDMARTQCQTEEIQIDNAVVSEGDDNGAWAQGWVWVDFGGTPFDKRQA